jgi:hypothetical protein
MPDNPFHVEFGDAPDYLMRKIKDDQTVFIAGLRKRQMEGDPGFLDYDPRVQELLPGVCDDLTRARNSQKGQK